MGLAYALWSGAGIILISTVGWIYFKQQLDFAAVVGLSFMIIGIEPYRVCRRVNILRDYPDDKIKIYP